MYKSIKLSCILHSSLSLKTEHDATSFSHTSAKPSRSHARTSGHVVAMFQATSEQICSYQSPDVGDFRSTKTWRLLNSNYSARLQRLWRSINGNLTFIFLFKLFSMEIENFNKTRVKFVVDIKRKIFRFNSLSGHGAKS